MNQPVMFRQENPSTKANMELARRLIESGSSTAPVGSTLEGVARLAQAMSGAYIQRETAKKDEKERREANASLVRGVSAKPWQPPQGELITDEEGYEIPPAIAAQNAQRAGGLDGASYALSQMPDNFHAQQMAGPMALQAAMHRQSREEKAADRQAQLANARELKSSPGWVAPKAPKPGVDVPLSDDVMNQKIELAQSGRPVNIGSIPSGFKLDGEKLVPIPGGPADKKEDIEKKETQARITSIDQNIKLVEELINHPGMSDVVGVPGSASGVVRQLLGRPLPATDAAGFDARLKQIQGKQFLEAFQNLKGGGQITEAEGAKATDAMSRLGQTNVRESEYKKAAQELVDILKAARSRVKGGDKVDPDNSTAVDDLLKKYIK